MVVETEWTEGSATPEPSIEEEAHELNTNSSDPCPECETLCDGTPYLASDAPALPIHNFCRCIGTSFTVTMQHTSRTEAATTTTKEREEAGRIAETEDDRERTRTFPLPDGGSQTEVCPEDHQMSISMFDTSVCIFYHVWEVTTTNFIDHYQSGDLSTTHTATRVERRYQGLEEERA